MGILYNRLMIVLNDADPDSADYHIALVMLQNLLQLASFSIGRMAELCAVSKSTVSKFVVRLGYESYKDFRDAAVFEVNKYGNTSNYVSNVLVRLTREPLEDYAKNVCSDLMLTARTLDWNAIDRLAHDLLEYKVVAAFGLMFSESAAQNLQTKLGYCGKFVITNLNDLKQDEFIRNAGPDTLIIVFSESGAYLDRYGTMIDDYEEKDTFSQTAARVVIVTANERALHDPRVAYGIRLRRTTGLHSHAYTYELVTDAIVHRYGDLATERHNRERGIE